MIQQLNDKRNNDDFINAAAFASKIYNNFSTMADKLFETRLGQTVMDVADRLLLIVEETTKWSLPQDNTEIKLVRPLPWILFLILIIWLRLLRFCLSIYTRMVGHQIVTPQIFVIFIQSQRQKIQNKRQLVDIQRNKNQNHIQNHNKNENENENQKEKLCLRGRLRMILSYIICRPGYIIDEPPTTLEMLLTKSLNDSDVTGTSEPSMQSQTTNSDINLIENEIIEKYCNESIDSDDEEFTISLAEGKEGKTAEDITSTSSEIHEIENHLNQSPTELEITEQELNDLKQNDEQFNNTTGTSILLAANNHCQMVKDEDTSASHIAPPKFIIDEYPKTAAALVASSTPINNIDNNKADNKAIVSKSNAMPEEIVKDALGHENNSTMRTSSYLSTVTSLTDSPYPSFYNSSNSNENFSIDSASFTPTPSNCESFDNLNAANKKPELQEEINHNTTHKKLSLKSSNSNYHTSKHHNHNHNKNRVKHHHYY